MNVRFDCPCCAAPARAALPGPPDWQCPACDHRLRFEFSAGACAPSACVVCGNGEFYKKKDFPHGLGMAILVVACLASFFTYGWYEKWLTWAILLGSAAFDCLLYLWVGDAIVCYRCGAQYRGCQPGEEHLPFELSTGERYRQERIRRELLESQRRASGPAN
jgi:hypothetical protein